MREILETHILEVFVVIIIVVDISFMYGICFYFTGVRYFADKKILTP